MFAQFVVPGALVSVGDEQITDLSTVKSLDPPTGVIGALLQAENDDIRFRGGSRTATTSVGTLLLDGQSAIFYRGDVSELTFVSASGDGSATLNVEYFGVF